MNLALHALLKSAVVGGCCVFGAAQANLLTNGRFEQGAFVDQGNDTETFTAGATTMTGWTTAGNYVSWIGPSNPFGLTAEDGSYFLDLTGYQAGGPFGGVTQTVATNPGQQYDLSFYLGSRTDLYGGPPVSIQASAAGVSQTFTDSASHDVSTWTLESFTFTATGTSTAITLLGTAGDAYIGLDNVDLEAGAVAAVPEPGTYALMLAGLGIVGFMARRSRT